MATFCFGYNMDDSRKGAAAFGISLLVFCLTITAIIRSDTISVTFDGYHLEIGVWHADIPTIFTGSLGKGTSIDCDSDYDGYAKCQKICKSNQAFTILAAVFAVFTMLSLLYPISYESNKRMWQFGTYSSGLCFLSLLIVCALLGHNYDNSVDSLDDLDFACSFNTNFTGGWEDRIIEMGFIFYIVSCILMFGHFVYMFCTTERSGFIQFVKMDA